MFNPKCPASLTDEKVPECVGLTGCQYTSSVNEKQDGEPEPGCIVRVYNFLTLNKHLY